MPDGLRDNVHAVDEGMDHPSYLLVKAYQPLAPFRRDDTYTGSHMVSLGPRGSPFLQLEVARGRHITERLHTLGIATS